MTVPLTKFLYCKQFEANDADVVLATFAADDNVAIATNGLLDGNWLLSCATHNYIRCPSIPISQAVENELLCISWA